MHYSHRTVSKYLKKASKSFSVVLVTGPRQVGKTTLLQHIAEEGRTYVTLDDPQIRLLANEDPALFMQRYEAPLFIDEIQYAPGLLPFIKMEVDKHLEPGMYWLTGSQQFHLMQNISESLAGRVGILKLQGLSYREKRGLLDRPPFLPTPEQCSATNQPAIIEGINDLYKLIWRGSFPKLVLDERIDHNLYYSSYVQTYLQRDIRDLARVGDEGVF